MKYVYTNDHPEVVVVVGADDRQGHQHPEGHARGRAPASSIPTAPSTTCCKFIPNADVLGAIATVDADGISGVRTVDFSGSEGGVDAAGIGAGIAAPIVGAMAKVTGMIKKENLAKIVSDVSGMERGYNEVKMQEIPQVPRRVFLGRIDRDAGFEP